MARKKKGRPINGIVLLDKPQGISSNHALQRVKRLFSAQKAGHTGALDPLATGMLPICFGEATKFTQFLLDTDKTYVVQAKLGVRTTTSDADGEVVSEKAVTCSPTALEEAVASFIGESDQYPSMYSALKYQGQPLYKYAREGIEVPRKCRRIHVYRLTLDTYDEAQQLIQMTAHVSKGTYIRTIVDDLGELLGCGAHVTQLHRTQVGHYEQTQMIDLEQLEALSQDSLDDLLLPMETALVDLPSVSLDEAAGQAFCHGQLIPITPLPEGLVKVVSTSGFIGVGERHSSGQLKAKRTLSSVE